MEQTIASLPPYLRKFCAKQDYNRYTSRDQAAWRYIMRQNRAFFADHAVPIYQKGLETTGIPIDQIPRIEDMDRALKKFGWGAVPVVGFIPSPAFLEFQARKILAIACDMRTVEHIAYTPAPDIVHEAAGHAPIVADPAYADYLTRYASMASHAIISKEDISLYEAIRYLSDIKENPDMTAAQIAQGEQRLVAATNAMTHVSENTMVARMAWWTVEYGLVGPMDQPKIFGAGLLSSVGESQACLSSKVKKIPLTVHCVETSYNITEPQPQLFVARDFPHLVEVLDDLEKRMSSRIGGLTGLERAQRAATINSVRLDSTLEVSGQLTDFEVSGSGHVEFIRFQGPVQLAVRGEQLPGHGRERHGEGFSSPLGSWMGAPKDDPALLSDDDLRAMGWSKSKRVTLKFHSGFVVEGILVDWIRKGQRLVAVTFRDARVTRGDKVYFDPAWGEFDLAVGRTIVSVFGGPADRNTYGSYPMGDASTSPGRQSPYTADEKDLFQLYSRLRQIRMTPLQAAINRSDLEQVARDFVKHHAREWLIGLEVLEIVNQRLADADSKVDWIKDVQSTLGHHEQSLDPVVSRLVRGGIQLLATS